MSRGQISTKNIDRTRSPRRVLRAAVSSVALICLLWWLPRAWAQWSQDAWYEGDALPQVQLGNGVWQWIENDLRADQFKTGSELFNGEWLFGTYMMAAMGYGQVALQHPEHRDISLERMAVCLEKILSEEVRAFDQNSWGNDPIETLDSPDHHHAAYLGYFNLALSLHRSLEPESPFASLNDRVTSSLRQRIEASPIGLIQTYPYEVYPVDNAAVVASIALHAKATGTPVQAFLDRWVKNYRERYIDPQSGLLIQAVDYRTGNMMDQPRGSGTSLAIYFLQYVSPELSRELYESLARELSTTVGGFTLMREYPVSSIGGTGDIDSGPLLFGHAISTTGFAIAGAKMHRDGDLFASLFASTQLFGAPLIRDSSMTFVTAGPIGNAIMFAMFSAPTAETLEDLDHPK